MSMKKTTITIEFEDELMEALKFFMFSKENTSPQKELEKILLDMYEKYVPSDTRHYLENKLKLSASSKVRQKKPSKPVTQELEKAEVPEKKVEKPMKIEAPPQAK